MTQDIIDKAKGTLKWFSSNSLLGALVEELERTRAEVDYWQGRALALEAAAAIKEEEEAKLQVFMLPPPAKRRRLADILPKWLVDDAR